MGDHKQILLYQIWDNTNWYRGTLTNPYSKYIQITLSQIQTKEPKVHKYQIPIRIAHKPKRESQIKSKSCNTREGKSPNHRTKTKWQQTSLTIPNYNPQISNN